MGEFLIRRGVFGLLTVFVVSLVVYIFMVMVPPGDPALRFAGKAPTPDLIKQIRHDYGFDKAFPFNYLKMMKLIVTGKIESRSTGAHVVQQAISSIPVTASLAMF